MAMRMGWKAAGAAVVGGSRHRIRCPGSDAGRHRTPGTLLARPGPGPGTHASARAADLDGIARTAGATRTALGLQRHAAGPADLLEP